MSVYNVYEHVNAHDYTCLYTRPSTWLYTCLNTCPCARFDMCVHLSIHMSLQCCFCLVIRMAISTHMSIQVFKLTFFQMPAHKSTHTPTHISTCQTIPFFTTFSHTCPHCVTHVCTHIFNDGLHTSHTPFYTCLQMFAHACLRMYMQCIR